MLRLPAHLLGVVGEDLERDRMLGDPLEQPLGELLVVGQPGLPHQRRVRREPGDARVRGEREDPVEIGPVGEDLDVRSSSTSGQFNAFSSQTAMFAAASRSGATDIGSGETPERLWALTGVLDRSGPAAGGRCRPATSASVSPIIHDAARSTSSARAASSSIPGAGLRQSQRPESAPATTPSGWCRQIRKPSRLDALGREQLENAGLDRCELLGGDESLGRRGLVGDADQQLSRRGKFAQRVSGARDEAHVLGPQGGLGATGPWVGDQLVDGPSRSRNAARAPSIQVHLSRLVHRGMEDPRTQEEEVQGRQRGDRRQVHDLGRDTQRAGQDCGDARR